MHRYYVTTAIPYVNGAPHLGFALELVQADTLARYHRLRGDDTRFLTGTDDNALKNVQAAERLGVDVRELVERNAGRFAALDELLGASNDDFIRTSSDPRHLEGAQAFWRACERSGDVYHRTYRGLYCVECEAYYAEDELVDGKCPEHGEPPIPVEEDNYFFRLSRYQADLERLLDSGELRIVPDHRHREVRAFVARGLQDFSISRSRARARGWGIPVPGDATQVMYVWFDALTNYINALGYGGDDRLYRRYWLENPSRVHVIGKDILRFHAVYWPAMLLSAGVPLPRTILVHGFLTAGGRRMSKSSGNVVDPFALAERYGVDALRYWLLREVPATEDADYTDARFERAYDAALANDLGNLVNRVVSMVRRYREGRVSAPERTGARGAGRGGAYAAGSGAARHRLGDGAIPGDVSANGPRGSASEVGATTHALDAGRGGGDRAGVAGDARALPEAATVAVAGLHAGIEALDFRAALDSVFALVERANRFVEETAPWALAKAGRDQELDVVLYALAETVRLVAEALRPFLPGAAERIAAQLGVESGTWPEALEWGRLEPGTLVGEPRPIFPRLAVLTAG